MSTDAGTLGRSPGHKCTCTVIAGALCALAAVPTALGSTGGMVPSLPPKVSGVECRASCTALDAVRPAGRLRLLGSGLSDARTVTFLGAAGPGDDVVVAVRGSRDGRLDVTVPSGARTGALGVTNAHGQASKPSASVISIVRGRSVGDLRRAGSSVDARVVTKRVLFAGRDKAQLTYLVLGSQAQAVRVDLVSKRTNQLVARWTPGTVAPNEPHSVSWSGLANGRLQREGSYQFRVYSGAAATTRDGGAEASQADPSIADSFTFLNHIFPIRGAHGYGGAGGRFGAGRSGHTHQGQDVFAPCGTPLVAARGGVVQHKAFHSAAGNYLVIDGAKTDLDYFYAHMRAPALVNQGERVYSGQLIGYVGDTGDARGCHLHFELWSTPGWYEGGSPFDPLPALKSWDRVS